MIEPSTLRLARGGWLTAGWPIEEGGQGRNAVELAPFYEEAALAGAPLDITLTTMLVAETLRRVGTREQQATILSEIINGNLIACLGLSEPDAGSDVAAVRTRAKSDGDEWVIDGQKMFTTGAQIADFVFLLARTNSGVPKHRGLTVFLVPMDTPGIEVLPVRTLSGERTNITFYSGVHVPDSARVGDVDGGWSVLMITLAFERGMVPTAAGRCRRLLDLAARWASGEVDDGGHRAIDDTSARRRLATIAIQTEVARLLGLRAVSVHAGGELPILEGSMAKLFATEALQGVVGSLLELIGPPGLLPRGTPGAPMNGEFEHAYRHAAVETIYSGTSEISARDHRHSRTWFAERHKEHMIMVANTKVALVTGASRGIGRAMAIDLAQHGYDIVPTARSLSESVVPWAGTLEETSERIRELGQRALPVKMDLAQQSDVRSGVKAALDEFGRIDVLITNGAFVDFAPDGTFLSQFINTSWESLERHIETNIVSTMLLHRLVLPVMCEQRSGIVMNITQNWSWISMPDLPMPGDGICGMAIPVTRGVTDRLAPCLKREVAPYGVVVLTLDPGLTLSSASERWEDSAASRLRAGGHPLRGRARSCCLLHRDVSKPVGVQR